MSKKQFAQTAPEVYHAQQAINFVLKALYSLAFRPDKPADVQQYDKYSLQIYHKLTVLKRSVLNSSGDLRYNLLRIPHYVDALAYCLLLPSKLATLALEILRLHCLDSQLLDHALLVHENILRGVRHAFSNYKDAQAACVFLLRDLSVSSYNSKILLYDENAIFVIANAFQAEENELLPLVKKAAIETIQTLSLSDAFVAQFIFEDTLIEQLAQTQVYDEIEAIVTILKTYHAEENFEADREQIEHIVSVIEAYESDVCEDFVLFARGVLENKVDDGFVWDYNETQEDVQEQVAVVEEQADY